MRKNPVALGVIFALACHLSTWLTLGIPTYFGYGDAGFIVSLVLLGLHVVLLGVLNHRAHFTADTFKRGLHFSVAYTLMTAALLIGETVFVANADLGTLEPHSSFFPGLGYVVFWVMWLIALGVDVVLLLVQGLVWWHRAHREKRL